MDELDERYDAVKITPGKDGKHYYYYKNYAFDNWNKISKFAYDNYLKDNSLLAIETEKDNSGNIVLMKFKHENFQQRKERLYGSKKTKENNVESSKGKGCLTTVIFTIGVVATILISLFKI